MTTVAFVLAAAQDACSALLPVPDERIDHIIIAGQIVDVGGGALSTEDPTIASFYADLIVPRDDVARTPAARLIR
jgi:hypothetical protein